MVEGLIILPGLPPHFLARETKVQRREAFLPGPKLETSRARMRTQASYLLSFLPRSVPGSSKKLQQESQLTSSWSAIPNWGDMHLSGCGSQNFCEDTVTFR